MPLPREYQRAGDQFYSLLTEVRDLANFGSSHQAFTMVQGVFQVFRRRLPIPAAIRFASALPAVLRALFIADWGTDQALKPFGSFDEMNKEVRQLRPKHNFSTDRAIQDVALMLRKYVDADKFREVMRDLPGDAQKF